MIHGNYKTKLNDEKELQYIKTAFYAEWLKTKILDY